MELDELGLGGLVEGRQQPGDPAQARALERLERTRPRWAQVVRRRLEGVTYEEIGREFGVSRERVRQLEQQALDRLRRWLLGRGLR